MAHAFYMDVHVPSAVTTSLRRRGVDVLTSQEDRMHESDDGTLLERATELDRVLFTQDHDLLAIASQCQRQSRQFGGVVYCHPLGSGIGGIVEDLELLAFCAHGEQA